MANKKIKMTLSMKSIDSAVKKLQQYRSDLEKKCKIFCEELMKVGQVQAEHDIAESPLGRYVKVTTDILPEKMGCRAILLATGGEHETSNGGVILPLMMIEFGAGVYYNPVPNPNADAFGMGVGTYPGQTHAFEDGWWYLGEDEQWHYTHGNKATMPMYNADMEMINRLHSIAKSVFKR